MPSRSSWDVSAMTDPIVKIRWKDEGEFGPITTIRQSDLDNEDSGSIGRPFDPDAPPPTWYSREEAMAIADSHGAEFEES